MQASLRDLCCPSCGQKRALLLVHRLNSEVFAPVPHRPNGFLRFLNDCGFSSDLIAVYWESFAVRHGKLCVRLSWKPGHIKWRLREPKKSASKLKSWNFPPKRKRKTRHLTQPARKICNQLRWALFQRPKIRFQREGMNWLPKAQRAQGYKKKFFQSK